ncbi:hypothetical protein Aph01nite_64420 [Acrocarpospora phusangensis]|uniref:Uncharacterized protein n=1 Tax=Acrocarpospora phusangensis TaxID=1070424 RepID=A0A919QFR9_9ACTN|nr:hypothetical protein [Acrocarpospora phusangensis]GIH28132.1 hypothetical protein Aph01nite_64420 [Acrocarpospora phusangensis]
MRAIAWTTVAGLWTWWLDGDPLSLPKRSRSWLPVTLFAIFVLALVLFPGQLLVTSGVALAGHARWTLHRFIRRHRARTGAAS